MLTIKVTDNGDSISVELTTYSYSGAVLGTVVSDRVVPHEVEHLLYRRGYSPLDEMDILIKQASLHGDVELTSYICANTQIKNNMFNLTSWLALFNPHTGEWLYDVDCIITLNLEGNTVTVKVAYT
jgi:hypothetical protein